MSVSRQVSIVFVLKLNRKYCKLDFKRYLVLPHPNSFEEEMSFSDYFELE